MLRAGQLSKMTSAKAEVAAVGKAHKDAAHAHALGKLARGAMQFNGGPATRQPRDFDIHPADAMGSKRFQGPSLWLPSRQTARRSARPRARWR